MSIYQRINGADWRNVWVVGDLHGCYTLLINELDKIKFDPASDLLISVGDMVDRGAENVECLDLINQPWFRAVRGNHEQMMIDGLSAHGNVNHGLLTVADGSLTLTTTKNAWLSRWPIWLQVCHSSSR